MSKENACYSFRESIEAAPNHATLSRKVAFKKYRPVTQTVTCSIRKGGPLFFRPTTVPYSFVLIKHEYDISGLAQTCRPGYKFTMKVVEMLPDLAAH